MGTICAIIIVWKNRATACVKECESMEQYRIALADDDRRNLRVAERTLSLQYNVISLGSGEELINYAKENEIDLILLGLNVVGKKGLETLQKLKASRKTRHIPVIFLTTDCDSDTETKAIAAGAADLVSRPLTASLLLKRVSNVMELDRLKRDLKTEAEKLSSDFMEEHRRNERLSMQVVKTLAGAVDAKDKYTQGHSTRVAEYSREIARSAGFSEADQEKIYMMGLLHDVGKIGVPDSVINKPTKLTPDEYEMIQSHPIVGHDILKNITELPDLAVAARWHHERYDGKGYPDGLAGTDIPDAVRIIAVADAYDAMSSRRSYHDVFAQEYIKSELRSGAGTQFDPRYAEIMLDMIEEDVEYCMREDPEAYVVSEQGVTVTMSQDDNSFVFGFLSMLEAGGLDTAVGLKYCLNETSFYAETLAEFTTTAEDRIRHLEECVGDPEHYKGYAHSLRYASRNVGAMEIFAKAEALEAAADEGNTAFLAENTPEVVADLRSILSSIFMALSIYGA